MNYFFRKNLAKYPVICVIGLAKNTGKTTTLNRLIHEAASLSKSIGLVSTGRDGETIDVFTHAVKPDIIVPQGTFFITTEKSLEHNKIEISVCEITDFITSMGRVIIAQARTQGPVEVAGPATVKETLAVLETLQSKYSTEAIFIDGAINRTAITTSRMRGGVILATGAVVGDMEQVISETGLKVTLMNLTGVNTQIQETIAINPCNVLLINSNNTTSGFHVPLLDNPDDCIRQIRDTTEYLYTDGAVTDMLVETLMQKARPLALVAEDASKIALSETAWSNWCAYGGKFFVKNAISLLAVTCNPHNPMGESFDPESFLKKMREHIPVPVYDVVMEKMD